MCIVSAMKTVGRKQRKYFVWISKETPLVGHIAFGVIDRGTSVVQVRPTTLCPLNCVFCSVDAGPWSRHRQAEYMVRDPEWLVEWVRLIARGKDVQVEALIDGVGDPFTYPWLVELVSKLKSLREVKVVSVETHGASLSKELAYKLDDAGLDRINLSIHSLDPQRARMLAGTRWYDVKRVVGTIEYIVENTGIDVQVTPVWIPGVNDEDIREIIRWAYSAGLGKKYPPVAIQKYVSHKYGRKPVGVREWPWKVFYKKLRLLEQELGVKLVLSPDDYGIVKTRSLPKPYSVGDKVKVRIVHPGWLHGELLGVDTRGLRIITVLGLRGDPEDFIGRTIRVKIISDKDNIYLARVLV